MDLTLGLELLALAFFLAVTTLSAAAESTLFRINRVRLRALAEQGSGRAEAVLRALDEPDSSYTSVAELYTLGLTGAGILTAMVVGGFVLRAAGSDGLAVLCATLVLILLLPPMARGVAVARPEATAIHLYRPLRLLATLLVPLLIPLRGLERLIARATGAGRTTPPATPEEEFRLLVEGGDDAGVLEQDEREMIHGIFELGEVTAREVMVPRIDVVGVQDDAKVEQVLDLIIATGHSRIPIYEQSIDNIVGFVYAKDVLKHLRGGQLGDPVRPMARPAYFVPETKKVDELLQELQQRRVHIAVVVDEYGGTAGLITIEDLLEEIVGEIRDEYDQAEEPHYEQVSEREMNFDARISIREVNELLSLDLPDDEFDTLGGLIYNRLGKVPVKGDEVRVDGCVVQVLSTEGRRVKKVRLLLDEDK